MPFFMVDDQTPSNAKMKRLVSARRRGDISAVEAIGQWTLAGASVQASLTDGMVSVDDLIRVMLDEEYARLLAAKLVEVGLWHGHGHSCPRCREVPPDHWLYHDWDDMRYGRGAQVKAKRSVSKELQDTGLKAAVWLRDCVDPGSPTTAHCRYCGVLMHRNTRRGDAAPQYDHVVPTLAIGLINIALVCAKCNKAKAQRLPVEAEMVLRPGPRDDGLPDPLRDDVVGRYGAAAPRIDPSMLMHAGAGPSRAPLGSVSPVVATAAAGIPPAARDGAVSALLSGAPKAALGVGISPAGSAAAGVPLSPAGGVPDGPRGPSVDAINVPDQSLDQVDRPVDISDRSGVLPRADAGTGDGGVRDRGRDSYSGTTAGTGPGRRRGRKRGRGGRGVASSGQPSGSPPSVPLPAGEFGSPFHGVSGRVEVEVEWCEEHGLTQPCRMCLRGGAADG